MAALPYMRLYIAAYWSKARKPIPLNPDDPNAAILMRGRKNSAQLSHELETLKDNAPIPKRGQA